MESTLFLSVQSLSFFLLFYATAVLFPSSFLLLFPFGLFAEFIEISTKKEKNNKTQSHNNHNYSTGSHLSMWNVWSFNEEYCAIFCGIKIGTNKNSVMYYHCATRSKLSQLFEKTSIEITVDWMPILINCFNSMWTKKMAEMFAQIKKTQFCCKLNTNTPYASLVKDSLFTWHWSECCASAELKDLFIAIQFFFLSLSFGKRTLSTLSMADYASFGLKFFIHYNFLFGNF